MMAADGVGDSVGKVLPLEKPAGKVGMTQTRGALLRNYRSGCGVEPL